MENNLCCVGREAAAAVAETATTSKGQTKVDVEETKHGRGKKGTRTDDDDDGVERRPRSAAKYYGFPATCGGIMTCKYRNHWLEKRYTDTWDEGKV